MYRKTYEYNDISLSPTKVSTLKSRREAYTGVKAFDRKYEVPIVAAPMPDVCDGNTAISLLREGAMPIIHRFMSIDDQVANFVKVTNVPEISDYTMCGCAIGVTGDYHTRFLSLYYVGCRIFCLDTANGANLQVKEAVEKIKSLSSNFNEKIYIIAGNVATKEGYLFISELGIDAVRAGIGGGKVCTTRTETGVYVPMATVISECASVQKEGYPLIIADGGIRTPSDVAKALALGADMVMIGSAFAGTEEAPGSVINDNGRLVKLYRGAASFGVQMEHTDNEPDYVEGKESFVEYKGKISKVVKRYRNGLRSSMSYMNARTLKEFRENCEIILI